VETLVSMSSMWMDSSAESRVEDSVGAGRGGLSVSKPIVESERFLEGGVGERRHARHRFPRIRGREKSSATVGVGAGPAGGRDWFARAQQGARCYLGDGTRARATTDSRGG
jgi:hypothetical protein